MESLKPDSNLWGVGVKDKVQLKVSHERKIESLGLIGLSVSIVTFLHGVR